MLRALTAAPKDPAVAAMSEAAERGGGGSWALVSPNLRILPRDVPTYGFSILNQDVRTWTFCQLMGFPH